MEALSKKYSDRLDEIASAIQASEALEAYLDTEEYDDYKVLIDGFEDQLQELYQDVADHHPLQLESLETAFLRDDLEGLYLPKIVGYTVLRGDVDENFKYRRPQSHFSDILKYIASSMNFGMIKMRVGQSIQTGFALSSDIWISNLVDAIPNKKVSYFLQSQKNLKFRETKNREVARNKYLKQFASLNYHTAEFPKTVTELSLDYYGLRDFLLYRASHDFDNSSLMSYIEEFIANKNLVGTDEYLKLMMIIGMKYDLSDTAQKEFSKVFKQMGDADVTLSDIYFKYLDRMHKSNIKVDREADIRISKLLKGNSTPEITRYYELMDTIHGKGFVHEDAIKDVRDYYLQHEGLSDENECLRLAILSYFEHFMDNLTAEEYQDYFEITKTITQYISTFSSEKFNQSIKDSSLKYIKRKLLKTYTDKRGRDYQDIKKFITATFTDLNFMTEKELKELFKTKRKPKKKD